MGTNTANPLQDLYILYSNIEEAAEDFNANFASKFGQPSNYILPDVSHLSDWNITISPENVLKELLRLKKKSPGHDLIPNLLYRSAAYFIAEPICHVFNLSILNTEVPAYFKIGHISPLPKTSHPGKNDLRPITLLPVLNKLLERLVLASLKETFILHFGPNQYGYRPHSSTTCALIAMHDQATSLLDQPDVGGVQIVSYDYSRAFDTIKHDLIIERLISCSFPRQFILWTKSYLLHRLQQVRIGNQTSTPLPVISGVPQGSVLGPFYFNLVVGSHTVKSTKTSCYKYADDTNLIFPLYKNCVNDYILQEHEHLLAWSMDNNLILNAAKSKMIIIITKENTAPVHINDVQVVDCMKILGVYFNNRLSWDDHISYIIKSCNRKMYSLRVLRSVLSEDELHKVYSSFIRPVLEYASPVFVSLNIFLSNSCNRLQKRAHSIICSTIDCSRFVTVTNRRHTLSKRLFCSISDNPDHILYSRLPPLLCRSDRRIMPFCSTSRRLNSFFPFCVAHNLY